MFNSANQAVHEFSNTFFVMPLWAIGLFEDDFEEEEIESGSLVSYYDETKEDYAYGIYDSLWQHDHPNETSPFFGDNRMMAYIRTATGATFADVEFIELLETDEIDILRYGLEEVAR